MEKKPSPAQPAKKRIVFLGRISLRAKLILGNMLIIAIAIVGTGYYVYTRTSVSSTNLTNQLEKNVLEQAQNELNNQSASRASDLNNFFIQMSRSISTIGSTASGMLSNESTLNNKAFWDASTTLSRLPDGSWDNPNGEPSSVFIPARVDLTDSLAAELNTIKQLDLTVPVFLKLNPDTVAIYFGGRSGETIYYPNIDLASIVPPDFDVTGRPWYVSARPENDPTGKAVWSAPYLDAALHGLVVTTSVPVIEANGTFRGVAAMDIQLKRITDLVSSIQAGKTGYAMVIDKDKHLIALPDSGYGDLGIKADIVPLGTTLDPAKLTSIPASVFSVFDKSANGKNGFDTLTIGGTQRFVSYNTIPEIGYSLIIIAPSNELLANSITARTQIAQETANTYTRSLLLVVVILVIALIATLILGNGLTAPLQALTRTAAEITEGNLTTEAAVRSRDEVGKLSAAINTMTSSMRNMIQSLEMQVQDRTNALLRKTLSLQSASLVAHDAAETQDLQTLLARTVEMITSRFDFYHVGIFLMDDTGEYVVLKAASSEGGKKMLARGHKLEVGTQGIVGTAAYQNQPQVVMDVEHDPIYFSNPELPLTRSEAAFPLKARGTALGILDIQSTQPSAFQQDDIEVLQTLADQIGLAIYNTRLIGESREAVLKLEVSTSENTRRVWRERAATNKHVFRYTSMGFTAAQNGINKNGGNGNAGNMSIPVLLRGQTIGTIVLHRSADKNWSEADRSLAAEIASQVGLALENARLLEEAQRRAAQEQSLSELTAHLSNSLDPEMILQTIVRELHQLPGVEEVSAYIAPQTAGPNTDSKSS